MRDVGVEGRGIDLMRMEVEGMRGRWGGGAEKKRPLGESVWA